MAALVFGSMDYAGIPVYREGELGKIMIVKAVTGHLLPAGELAIVLPDLCEPVAEHCNPGI